MGQSLQPDRSSGHDSINSHQHSDYTDEPTSPPHLRRCVKLLFSLQGAAMQLPSLALMAIVNDRVAIPPAYLPAYSAVCFLPHSLKPLWAALSTLGDGSTSKERHIHMLLGILLATNGLTYLGTALWIPVKGVFECFVWGFLRGVTDAWSQFLTDQLLIHQAQSDSSSSSKSYEAVSSIFQSHAATYSSGGSLVASVVSFAIFAVRQIHNGGDGTHSPLNSAVVSALLFVSAVTCFAGSAAMIHQLHIAKSTPAHPNEGGCNDTYALNSNGQQGQQQPKCTARLFATLSILSSTNYSVAPGHGRHQEYEPLASADSLTGTTEPSSSVHLPLDPSLDCGPQQSQVPTTFRDKSDVACLVLLQMLLVGGAVKHSIGPLDRGGYTWAVVMTLLATCFVGSVVVSSCWTEHPRYGDGNLAIETVPMRNASATISARRLGLFLMLRHSVPNADFLMYSFIYDVFGKHEPILIQGLAIFQSAASLSASWVFGRFLAARFHSGWGIVGLIATLSILTSLISLLDITIVHATIGKEAVDRSLQFLVLTVGIFTSFMGQIGYMPSVILATANVVTSTDSSGTAESRTRGSDSSLELMTPRCDAGNSYVDAVHDEGIQYATFVACIDFGAQLGDWISVPIISALGIKRENQWANLDKLIILCATMRIASLAFLFIIRPYSPSPTTITLPNESQYVLHMSSGLDVAPRSRESSKDNQACCFQGDHSLTI